MSKLAGDSGSRASMLMVRQLMVAMIAAYSENEVGRMGSGGNEQEGRKPWSVVMKIECGVQKGGGM
jgi:hypothetical protein